MTYKSKTDDADSMGVYMAGVMCSAAAWIFPLSYLIDQREDPWPIAAMMWIVGMVFMSAGSWAGVGMAIGIVLMHVMGAL